MLCVCVGGGGSYLYTYKPCLIGLHVGVHKSLVHCFWTFGGTASMTLQRGDQGSTGYCKISLCDSSTVCGWLWPPVTVCSLWRAVSAVCSQWRRWSYRRDVLTLRYVIQPCILLNRMEKYYQPGIHSTASWSGHSYLQFACLYVCHAILHMCNSMYWPRSPYGRG